VAPKSFTLTAAHTAILAAIASGERTRITQTEGNDLVANGYIEVNTNDVTDAGALVRLTDKGVEAAPKAPAATPTISFAIAANLELPPISRNGSGGRSKYPLGDIPLMGGLFIPTEAGKDTKAASKRFGSMVADFNKENADKYLTARTLEDGGKAGFGEQYNGVAGVGIYHRPVSEKPAPRKPKATAAE
jgi:hypothetical protein